MRTGVAGAELLSATAGGPGTACAALLGTAGDAATESWPLDDGNGISQKAIPPATIPSAMAR